MITNTEYRPLSHNRLLTQNDRFNHVFLLRREVEVTKWLSREDRRDVIITNKGSSHSLITDLCDFFIFCVIVYFYNAHFSY